MIKRWIDNLPQDKKDHIIVGVLYSILIPMLGYAGTFLGFPEGAIYGGTVGFLIGTGLNLWKELWHDKHKKKGNAEVMDFIFNEVPILITYIAFIL